MAEGRSRSVMDYFGELEDPRIERCKRHSLLDIITIAICAVICGADSWVHVAMFGKSKEEWFWTFLDLPNGIPSHDTFGEVFSRLDPGRFQECFMEWSQGVAESLPGEVVAIDGKTVRRSHDTRAGKGEGSPSGQRLGLGQHSHSGTGKYGGEVQRDHRHSQVAGPIGPEWVHRHHRRHGLPEGDCPGHTGAGSQLCPGGEAEPEATVRGLERPV